MTEQTTDPGLMSSISAEERAHFAALVRDDLCRHGPIWQAIGGAIHQMTRHGAVLPLKRGPDGRLHG